MILGSSTGARVAIAVGTVPLASRARMSKLLFPILVFEFRDDWLICIISGTCGCEDSDGTFVAGSSSCT